MQWITTHDLEWAYQNRHEYIGICGTYIHINEYPYILEVLEKTNFKWYDYVDSVEVIQRCQQAIKTGNSREELVAELLMMNKEREKYV